MSANHGLILVVDDEPDLVEVITEFLKRHDYGTLAAKNGEQALRIYRERQNEISLVLSDINMPLLDGIGFLKSCLAEFGHVPLVLLTAQADFTLVTEALRLGATDYVAKPIDFERLERQLPVWKEIARRRAAHLTATPFGKTESLLRLRNNEMTQIDPEKKTRAT